MWIFLSAGMMMPALIPQSVLDAAKTVDIQEAVDRGWELQVRGRVREHLEHFIETYMPADSCSVVYESKGKDYNVRAYTSREAFGKGLLSASLDIDYVKFKETAERFSWGKAYHALLLKVWGDSTMLGRPYAGEWKYGDSKKSYKARKRGNPRRPKYTGSTFFDDYDWDAPGGYDDLPMALTRSSNRKSIHDMTDAELEDYEYDAE